MQQHSPKYKIHLERDGEKEKDKQGKDIERERTNS